MIELIATAPDGWAIVQQADTIWLLRPPYRQRDRDRLTPLQADRALLAEDFESCDASYDGWGQLCRDLEARRAASASDAEREAATTAAANLLARATGPQARRHLERIRSAIETRQLRGVEAALFALLQAPAVQQEPSLVAEAVAQMSLARSARSPRRRASRPQAAWVVSDEESVDRLAGDIAERGSLLAA